MLRVKFFYKIKYKIDVLRWYWLCDIIVNLEEDKKGISFLVNIFRVVNIYRSKCYCIWVLFILVILNYWRLYLIEECLE